MAEIEYLTKKGMQEELKAVEEKLRALEEVERQPLLYLRANFTEYASDLIAVTFNVHVFSVPPYQTELLQREIKAD